VETHTVIIPSQFDFFHTATFAFVPPFRLTLADGNVIHAEEVVRLLPKKRLVAFGTWQQTPIVAKLFFDPHHAKRDMERDAAGIAALLENNIPTPPLLYQGVSEDGRIHVLIYERIYDALSLEEAWRNRENANDMLSILRPVIVEIATQHVLGVVQHDLHLNNFLLTKKKIYTLDGAQIETCPRLLSKKKSMRNLALFLSQLGVGVENCQEALFKLYAKARGWMIKKSDILYIFYLIKQWDEKRWHRYEKKIFRNCTDFSHLNYWCSDVMVDRRALFPEMSAFLKNPESLFSHPASQLLKAGRSSTVIKVVLDNKTYIVKRYNLKNSLHFLRRCLRPTRARRSWRLSHKLNLFGVAIAKPIAFIERSVLGLRGKSYYVSDYISSEHIGDYFTRHQHDVKKTDAMVERVVLLLKNLAKLEMTHGDLKMTNILMDQREQPVLIDLDGTSEYATLTGLRQAWDKEIQRFLQNFETMPTIAEKFKSLLLLERN